MSRMSQMSLIVALVLAFAPALVAGTKVCPISAPPTPESYTWDFPAETTDLLREIERDALLVKQSAIALETFIRFPMLFSEASHSTELSNARYHINRMGDKLCRLLEIQRVAHPWQQKTVDELKVTLTALATDAERAIEFLNEPGRPTNLADPVYAEYLAGVYREASSLRNVSEMTWRETLR